MAKFASAAKQAASVMKILQRDVIRSVGTVRNYEQALTRVTEYVKSERLGSLRALTIPSALAYLEQRGQTVGQKTLDMERQAIQAMLHHVTQILPPNQRLPVIKSDHQQKLSPRSYTAAQVAIICHHQYEGSALATKIAHAAGLRAHELFTLRPIAEQPPDPRPSSLDKWTGRTGIKYTVCGKGGLVRTVLIPHDLAETLESQRLATPEIIQDRKITYPSHYAITGGNRWSSSFSTASQRALGWSAGAHGLRHSYAQERMLELQQHGFLRTQALTLVSQEMGHFRAEITETYLR